MSQDINIIRKILEAIETKVDSKTVTPKLEKPYSKVSDTTKSNFNYDEKGHADFKKVSDGGKKKIDTTPTFPAIKDTVKGGAKTNAKPGNKKNVFDVDTKGKLKEGEGENLNEIKSFLEFMELKVSSNPGNITLTIENKSITLPLNPQVYDNIASALESINTDQSSEYGMENNEPLEEMNTNRRKLTGRPRAIGEAEEFESTLSEAKKIQAKRLREAIESITKKKVVYQNKK